MIPSSGRNHQQLESWIGILPSKVLLQDPVWVKYKRCFCQSSKFVVRKEIVDWA